GRLATKSNQIKQLIRNGRSASLQRTFKKSFTSFSHSTRNKTRDGLIRVRNIRRSAHKFEQICRHRLRRQNVGYSNFSQPQSHLSFCVLLQYLVERRRVVTQLGKLD